MAAGDFKNFVEVKFLYPDETFSVWIVPVEFAKEKEEEIKNSLRAIQEEFRKSQK